MDISQQWNVMESTMDMFPATRNGIFCLFKNKLGWFFLLHPSSFLFYAFSNMNKIKAFKLYQAQSNIGRNLDPVNRIGQVRRNWITAWKLPKTILFAVFIGMGFVCNANLFKNIKKHLNKLFNVKRELYSPVSNDIPLLGRSNLVILSL